MDNLKEIEEGYKQALEQIKEVKEKMEKQDKDMSRAITAPTAGASSNSLEQQALKYYRCKNPLELTAVNTAAQEHSWVPQEVKGYVKSLKSDFANARMIAQRFHGAPLDRGGEMPFSVGHKKTLARDVAVRNILETPYGKEVLAPKLKAFGSTVGGAGDEYVPTILAQQFIDEYELERKVERMFRRVQMPSNPYEIPVKTNVTEARRASEGNAMTDTNFGTSKVTFNAIKAAEYMILPEELNEDSAPDVFAMIREELVEAQERAVEQAILNGDTAGTHQDSDTDALGADVAAKFWDGLRKQAIATSSTVPFNSQITEAKLGDMRGAMGKFGVDPMQLAWIVSPLGYQQMLKLDDVTTVEKYGNQATVLRGALAIYQGINIIVSEFVREDLNAAGVHDGVTADNTAVHLVNMRRWMVGARRAIQLKIMMDLPDQDRWKMASYQRVDFKPVAASEKSSILGVDVSIA
jgi:hypothetical protein